METLQVKAEMGAGFKQKFPFGIVNRLKIRLIVGEKSL
jgi:hypothetical protein